MSAFHPEPDLATRSAECPLRAVSARASCHPFGPLSSIVGGLIDVSSLEFLIRGSAMGLAWFRKPRVSVEVLGAEIIVRMPGTSFSVVYEKTDENQLIASSFSARKPEDEKRKVSFPQFLALAWTAANAKAKEIGWIA